MDTYDQMEPDPSPNITTLIGENMSVILNKTVPSSTLKKKMYAIAYHKIRETIAGGFVTFAYIHSTKNVADILTKPLGGVTHHRLLKEYMFRRPLTMTGGGKDSNVVQDENIYVNLSINPLLAKGAKLAPFIFLTFRGFSELV